MSNRLSWCIIKQFSRRNIFGFTIQDVVSEFPGKNHVYLTKVLADMVDKGMLFRISRGSYHIIPLTANPETYFPGGHQVVKYIMRNKEYYIGYSSALNIHGLALQHGAKEYVVTRKQMKPAIRNLGGITYQFIQHTATRFFGFSSIWINQLEKAMVSDLERTIVDIATMPQLCGGITEVANVIYQVRYRLDHYKLFYYLTRNLNNSAKSRFLFLTDLLGLEWTTEHNRMMGELGSGFSLLDPAAPDQGRKRSKFRLKINVDPISIKKKVLHRRIS